jgi:hypothetical protein
MASEGEFLRPRAVRSATGLSVQIFSKCPVAGTPAHELYEPVVAFARSQLVQRLDPFARDASTPVRTRLEVPGVTAPPTQRGIEIVVDPRSTIGQVIVSNWWRDGGTSHLYCLHVSGDHGVTTVVVEELWMMISTREAVDAPPLVASSDP